jgi:hypothetical protein
MLATFLFLFNVTGMYEGAGLTCHQIRTNWFTTEYRDVWSSWPGTDSAALAGHTQP